MQQVTVILRINYFYYFSKKNNNACFRFFLAHTLRSSVTTYKHPFKMHKFFVKI